MYTPRAILEDGVSISTTRTSEALESLDNRATRRLLRRLLESLLADQETKQRGLARGLFLGSRML